MKGLSKGAKVFLILVLFGILCVPATWVWGKLVPSYNRLLASVGGTFINAVETTGATYTVAVDSTNFHVGVTVPVGLGPAQRGKYELQGKNPANMVSFNLILWAALLVATVAFVGWSARWKYLLIAPAVLFVWHIFDLAIFAKLTRWIAVKDVYRQYPNLVDYSYAWEWFWWWAKEFNRYIIVAFLPLLLWIVLCFRSFRERLGTSSPVKKGKES
jgi:hypothetical protein